LETFVLETFIYENVPSKKFRNFYFENLSEQKVWKLLFWKLFRAKSLETFLEPNIWKISKTFLRHDFDQISGNFLETHKKGLWKLWKLFSYFQNFGNFGNFPIIWKLWKLSSELSEKICTIAMIIIMSSVAFNIMAIDLQLITPSYHLAPHIIL
jgi:hypothetical protein